MSAEPPLAGAQVVAQGLEPDQLLVLDQAIAVGNLAEAFRSIADRRLGLGVQLVDSPVPCLGARAVHVGRV